MFRFAGPWVAQIISKSRASGQDTFVFGSGPGAGQDIFIFGSGPTFQAILHATIISHSPWQKVSSQRTFCHRFETQWIRGIEVSSQLCGMNRRH